MKILIKKDTLSTLKLYLVVMCFSYVFVYIIPWSSFTNFGDIDNYLWRIAYLANSGTEKTFSGATVLVSEWLWRSILIQMGGFKGNALYILYLTSLFSLTVYSFFVYKRVELFVAVYFFFNPLFIDLIMGQLRISLAFSLLVLAYQTSRKRIYIALIISAVFIHAASIIIVTVFYLLVRLNRVYDNRKFYFYSIILGLLIALFLKFGVDVFLTALEDKRANYGNKITGSSVSFSIFWFVMAIMLALTAQYNIGKDKIIVGFSITMMTLFFITSLLGIYGQRYVAISIPMIITSIYYIHDKYRLYTFVSFGIYQLLQWYYWLVLY